MCVISSKCNKVISALKDINFLFGVIIKTVATILKYLVLIINKDNQHLS